MSPKDPLLSVSLFCHLASIILCALILSETLALHKSFTYLLTYLLTQMRYLSSPAFAGELGFADKTTEKVGGRRTKRMRKKKKNEKEEEKCRRKTEAWIDRLAVIRGQSWHVSCVT